MSDDKTGEPKWPHDESMKTVSSTEGAGQEGPCANPAQTGMQASAPVEDLRSRQYAYVQARLSAIEERMGINIPTGAQTWGEAMETIGVITSPSLNVRSSSWAPMVDTLAPGETGQQKMGKGEESVPLSPSEGNAVTGVTPTATDERWIHAVLARRALYTGRTSSQSGRTGPG